jgi:hypothetical protein
VGLMETQGSPDVRDSESLHLLVGEEFYLDKGTLTRECLIARREFFLDSSKRGEILGEKGWTHIKDLTT